MLDKILVPLDGSALAACVLPHVMAMTRALGAKITLLRVLNGDDAPAGVVDPVDWQLRKIEAQSYLQAHSARLGQWMAQPPTMQVLEGSAAKSIVEYAQKHEFDLVAFSSHGHGGLNGWNVSSVAQKVIDRVRKSILLVRAYQPCPALAAENPDDFRYRRILVPLDGSQRAEAVLPIVTALAHYYDAELLLVHVVVRPELIQHMPLAAEDVALLEQVMERNRAQAIQYFATLQARLPLASRLQIEVSASVAATLHNLVEQADADLVVLCAHGHSGPQQRPYGSVATSFITYGATPLLILQDLPPHEIPLSTAERMSEEVQYWPHSWQGALNSQGMDANVAV